MDINENDVLEYLIDDDQTGVVAMYLESIEQGRRFYELCQSSHKPLIVLKSGRTPSGAKAAMSHTASLAQNDDVVHAALRQAGVIRVNGLNEMIHVARSVGLHAVTPKKNATIAVLAFSGGAGVLAADFIGSHGMSLTRLNDSTIHRLKEVFPDWMDPFNPVDLYPAMEKNGRLKALLHALEAVMADPDVDGVYTHIIVLPSAEPMVDYDKISMILKKYKKPMVAWSIGFSEAENEMARGLEQIGVPVVDEIETGARILAALTTGQ